MRLPNAMNASRTSKVLSLCFLLHFYMNLNAYRWGMYIGDLGLQLETVLESCNEAYPRRVLQESNDKSACQSNKRQKLCEPLPCTKSMCQKLDDVCLENNWVLPSYHVSLSDGGFKAEGRIKETHFAHTICGEEKSDAAEARESAADCLLACLLNTLHQDTTTAKDLVPEDLGKDKVSKYGDRLLETIESTIKEYYGERTEKLDFELNDKVVTCKSLNVKYI